MHSACTARVGKRSPGDQLTRVFGCNIPSKVEGEAGEFVVREAERIGRLSIPWCETRRLRPARRKAGKLFQAACQGGHTPSRQQRKKAFLLQG